MTSPAPEHLIPSDQFVLGDTIGGLRRDLTALSTRRAQSVRMGRSSDLNLSVGYTYPSLQVYRHGDKLGWWNGSNGFTAPSSGLYSVGASVTVTAPAGASGVISVIIVATGQGQIGVQDSYVNSAAGKSAAYLGFATDVVLAAGDQVSLSISNATGVNCTLYCAAGQRRGCDFWLSYRGPAPA